jgi:hypothetical protein
MSVAGLHTAVSSMSVVARLLGMYVLCCRVACYVVSTMTVNVGCVNSFAACRSAAVCGVVAAGRSAAVCGVELRAGQRQVVQRTKWAVVVGDMATYYFPRRRRRRE